MPTDDNPLRLPWRLDENTEFNSWAVLDVNGEIVSCGSAPDEHAIRDLVLAAPLMLEAMEAVDACEDEEEMVEPWAKFYAAFRAARGGEGVDDA